MTTRQSIVYVAALLKFLAVFVLFLSPALNAGQWYDSTPDSEPLFQVDPIEK